MARRPDPSTTLLPVLTPFIKAGMQTYFLKKRETIERKRAEAQQDALTQVTPTHSRTTPEPQPEPEPEPESSRSPSAVDRIDDHIQSETCGTCRMALQQLKSQPPAQQQQGLHFYETEYVPTRDAFEAGEIEQAELETVTEELFERTGLA